MSYVQLVDDCFATLEYFEGVKKVKLNCYGLYVLVFPLHALDSLSAAINRVSVEFPRKIVLVKCTFTIWPYLEKMGLKKLWNEKKNAVFILPPKFSSLKKMDFWDRTTCNLNNDQLASVRSTLNDIQMLGDVEEVSYGSAYFDELKEIRIQVFVDEQGVPLEEEFDGFDASSVHLGYRNYLGTFVGVCRLRLVLPFIKLERVAVLKSHRQYRVGSHLNEAAVRLTRQRFPHLLLVAHSQSSVTPFYQKLGYCIFQVFHPLLPFYYASSLNSVFFRFIVVSKEFLEVDIPHHTVVLPPTYCNIDRKYNTSFIYGVMKLFSLTIWNFNEAAICRDYIKGECFDPDVCLYIRELLKSIKGTLLKLMTAGEYFMLPFPYVSLFDLQIIIIYGYITKIHVFNYFTAFFVYYVVLNISSFNICFDFLNNILCHRTVPVELGEKYTEDNWSQRLMSGYEFFSGILGPIGQVNLVSKKPMYLAQHRLLDQIPRLKDDIIIPEYCLATGCSDKDIDMNIWIGPGNTLSPLHTDPRENLFCQVSGRKFIRLISPDDSKNVYFRYLLQYVEKMIRESADELKALGNKYFQQNRFHDAVDAYSKAIIRNPQVATFFTNRALCHIQLKAWSKAADDCRKASDLDRNSVKAYYFWGRAAIQLGNYEEAIKLLTKANELAICQKVNFGDEIHGQMRLARREKFRCEDDKRIKQEIDLQIYLEKLIEEDVVRRLNALESPVMSKADDNVTDDEQKNFERDQLLQEAQQHVAQLNSMFAQVYAEVLVFFF
uniref:RING-type E3 ubiquitin transferase n=1 Tax=Heterorhabditis bacteriophora TaxID=37862 RepID=A0A1I7WIN2_HETBA